jgi:hypothetical protein
MDAGNALEGHLDIAKNGSAGMLLSLRLWLLPVSRWGKGENLILRQSLQRQRILFHHHGCIVVQLVVHGCGQHKDNDDEDKVWNI